MVPETIRQKKPLIISTLLCACALVWLAFFVYPRPQLQFWVLDVGQGDALLVRTPERHLILIDGGPDKTVLTRLGETLPFWCRELDLVVLTHADADHVTGLTAVLEKYSVEKVLMAYYSRNTKTYKIFKKSLIEKGVPIWEAEPGKTVVSGKVRLDILWPPPNSLGVGVNDLSVVFFLDYRDFEILLSGDLEERGQSKLLAMYSFSPLEVFKVPHHGADCLHKQLLAQINPSLSVISVGKDNAYGHPSAKTLQKLSDISNFVFRTDKKGTVKIVTDGVFWGYTVD